MLSAALPLAGFGVALDLKSMEYVTIDSAQLAGGNGDGDNATSLSAVAAEQDDDDLEGFVMRFNRWTFGFLNRKCECARDLVVAKSSASERFLSTL